MAALVVREEGCFHLNLQALKSVMYRQQGHTIHLLQLPKSSFGFSGLFSDSISALELFSDGGTPDTSARARSSGMSSSFFSVVIIWTSNVLGHCLA